jgi:hypothetical protein
MPMKFETYLSVFNRLDKLQAETTDSEIKQLAKDTQDLLSEMNKDRAILSGLCPTFPELIEKIIEHTQKFPSPDPTASPLSAEHFQVMGRNNEPIPQENVPTGSSAYIEVAELYALMRARDCAAG